MSWDEELKIEIALRYAEEAVEGFQSEDDESPLEDSKSYQKALVALERASGELSPDDEPEYRKELFSLAGNYARGEVDSIKSLLKMWKVCIDHGVDNPKDEILAAHRLYHLKNLEGGIDALDNALGDIEKQL